MQRRVYPYQPGFGCGSWTLCATKKQYRLLQACGVRHRGPVERHGVEQLPGVAADVNDTRLPEVARACVAALGAQLRMLKVQILQFDRMISAWHRSNEASRRLDDIPGVGPAMATALVASVADPKAFRSGRDFSCLLYTSPSPRDS